MKKKTVNHRVNVQKEASKDKYTLFGQSLPRHHALIQRGLYIERVERRSDEQIIASAIYNGSKASVQCSISSPRIVHELDILLKLRDVAKTPTISFFPGLQYIAQLKHHFNVQYQLRDYTCLVLSYIGGYQLADLATVLTPLKANKLNPLLKQVIYGVAYLHSIHLMHLNISPSSIFVRFSSDSSIPVITILGFTNAQWQEPDGEGGFLPGLVLGENPLLKSPESFYDKAVNEKGYDAWTIAVSFYKVCYGFYPFEKEYTQYYPQEYRLFIDRMQHLKQDDIQQRLPPKDMRSRMITRLVPNSFIETLDKLMRLDPAYRILPEELVKEI
ncbi:kinase-like domain-containing protein [Syncephalis plumigaleata]|nr:kinase-like domain-containing protein [Syncephalis plumigaleata]